jgi:plastocyanin
MYLPSGVARTAILAFSALLVVLSATLQAREQGNKKPSLSLKASPAVSFAPSRVVLVAEVKNGANDNEEFYCPTVEWEWGDLTSSVAEADCDPYEAGKSEIKRRYTIEHRFKNPGSFRIVLRLKKGTRVIAMANTQVQVRAGLGQFGQ